MSLAPEIAAYLRQPRSVAVVGLSSSPSRPSYGVARYLQQQGFRIVAVNPNESEVLGAPAFATLDGLPPAVLPIEIVDVFRRSEYVPEVAAAAVRIGARLLWLQEGVRHAEAEAMARSAGLWVVADRCILKEHHRLQQSN